MPNEQGARLGCFVLTLVLFGYCYFSPSDDEKALKIRDAQVAKQAVADSVEAQEFYRKVPGASPQILLSATVETCLGLLGGIAAAPESKIKTSWQEACQRAFDAMPPLSKAEVLAARAQYTVEVVDFDASAQIGSGYSTANSMRLRIHNGSRVRLSFLTIRVNRLGRDGSLMGWSRAPAVPVGHILPDSTAVVSYNSVGHLPGVAKMTVQVERDVKPSDEQFIDELKGVRGRAPAPPAPAPESGPRVSIGTSSDDVLALRGKAQSVTQVGSDDDGLLVEWRYADVTYTFGRREKDGVAAYRVIRITPQ